MLKSHEKFHSVNGKRQILVADDEMINREILREMLSSDYEVLLACDGNETMELMHRHQQTLSLVLLDILMPGMSGLEVLRAVREEGLSRIPIIVTTAETETELESLNLGAVDFIPKPYPAVDVIRARILRIIELSEDRDIIHSTERDQLTGLYNKDYFYRYAQQYDQFHQDTEMDATLVDVNHFHMINERYGKAYGDEVLRRLGEHIRDMVKDTGGIVCRREADTFLVYCPHREDYRQILQEAAEDLADGQEAGSRVRLRMGVYANVDKSIDIDRRFDRAKMAADTVKGSYTNSIGSFDSELHEKLLYAERLIEDFPAAIAGKQFHVYYQPKFDVRPDTPILASAEALVRWIHPELGFISPGVFIPLFEENGLIQKLDTYVWEETAAQIRKWKDQLHYSIPVSVNVSRIDMYDPDIVEILEAIIARHGLSGRDMLLEVTESAYTEESEQIIEKVNALRDMGFQIEMDDFGTGYSSLNMISTLPIDALKLDMMFIRDAFREGGNTHMLEVIIEIAKYLSVPVIAEGVETEDQLHTLKNLGCDLVQGYFFSKPVPAEEFEPFILQKKEADLAGQTKAPQQDKDSMDSADIHRHVQAQILGRKQEDPEEPQPLPEEMTDQKKSGIRLRTISILFVVLSLLTAASLMVTDLSVTRGHQNMEAASDRYIEAQMAAKDMETSSDYLTDRVRSFVVTGNPEYLKEFCEEVEVNRNRDKALEKMETLLKGYDSSSVDNLKTALDLSNGLVEVEETAIRLRVEAGSYNANDIPPSIQKIQLTAADQQLTNQQKLDKAQELVYGENYILTKNSIRENVGLCTQSLILVSGQELEGASEELSRLVHVQTIFTILFLLIVLVMVLLVTVMIRQPLTNMVERMRNQQTIPPTGVEELRFVTRTYNRILQENRQAREKLSHEASHDALTGLFNRGAYDLLMKSVDTEHMGLILIDVDYFKSINDTYGHAVGDQVLQRVAQILRQNFRSVDILSRIGGDEFAVVMTRVNSTNGPLVKNKIRKANDLLQHPKDDLPPVSLSVGIAFSDRKNPQGDIFQDADTALYRVKEAGRNGCAIYE